MRLSDVNIYPNPFPKGRKAEGVIEAHANGFRFVSKKTGDKFGNVPPPSEIMARFPVLERQVRVFPRRNASLHPHPPPLPP